MDELRPRAPRTSSRTVAMVVATALIGIAVAGIVIVVLRGPSPARDAPPTASASASAPAAAASRPARGADDPNRVNFSANSDELSPAAVDDIRIMAESAKNVTSAVVLSGKIEAGSGNAARMDLAKKRINAVRRALQSNGISPARVRVEVAEYPVGRIPPREADSVEMNLR